ncbi:MAG: hypothetical protein V3U02_08145 [Calditrichia bacterium]
MNESDYWSGLSDAAHNYLRDYWDRMRDAANEGLRPSSLYKPSLSMDGNQWCALFGPNPMEGVAGFGDTPAEAFMDFDINWENSRITIKEKQDLPM